MKGSYIRILFEGMDTADEIKQEKEDMENLESCLFHGHPLFVNENGVRTFINMDKVLYVQFHYEGEEGKK